MLLVFSYKGMCVATEDYNFALFLGVTLVVSPLVSLMEDQIMGLKALNIEAQMLSASSTREQVNGVHAVS